MQGDMPVMCVRRRVVQDEWQGYARGPGLAGGGGRARMQRPSHAGPLDRLATAAGDCEDSASDSEEEREGAQPGGGPRTQEELQIEAKMRAQHELTFLGAGQPWCDTLFLVLPVPHATIWALHHTLAWRARTAAGVSGPCVRVWPQGGMQPAAQQRPLPGRRNNFHGSDSFAVAASLPPSRNRHGCACMQRRAAGGLDGLRGRAFPKR